MSKCWTKSSYTWCWFCSSNDCPAQTSFTNNSKTPGFTRLGFITCRDVSVKFLINDWFYCYSHHLLFCTQQQWHMQNYRSEHHISTTCNKIRVFHKTLIAECKWIISLRLTICFAMREQAFSKPWRGKNISQWVKHCVNSITIFFTRYLWQDVIFNWWFIHLKKVIYVKALKKVDYRLHAN